MTLIAGYDPLALLAIQSGQIGPPRDETGAAGASVLDVDQRSVNIGEPVPIVFCRRRDDKGGVLISPGATEARFENDTSNNVTAYYHLVLSEGRIGDVAVRDVFQRSCRVGTFTQTYNRRAGTWTPGNFVVPRAGFDEPDASYYCGSIGIYPDMSTFSFQVTIPDGFDQWKRQVHLFIRNGIQVTRLIDNVLGSSDNFADLVRWMLLNGRRVPTQLVDVPQLQKAAVFLEANGFTCNAWIQQSRNYSDLLATWAPYFLLGESNDGGKKGLRPLLPTNNDGTLKTDAIDWEYIFTDNEILPGTFELEYTSFAQRLPFVAQMTWRQQLENDIGIIRTAEVRYINTAEVGPYESHDMSEYCTSENHAVKIGAYILARRRFVTHTIRFAARPQAHNRLLAPGDICRVKLAREIIGESPSEHDYLYQVERVTKTLAGQVGYECSHFPIDSQGRSIIALNVVNATGTGILLTSNLTGVGCDINSPTDDTIPVESFIVPGSAFDVGGFNTGTIVATGAGAGISIDDLGVPDGLNLGVVDIGSGSSGGSGGGGGGAGGGGGEGPGDSEENPSDPLDEPDDPFADWPEDYPRPGDPEWPEDWPTSPVPGDPAGYVVPRTPSDFGFWPDEPVGAFGHRFFGLAYSIELFQRSSPDSECLSIGFASGVNGSTNAFFEQSIFGSTSPVAFEVFFGGAGSGGGDSDSGSDGGSCGGGKWEYNVLVPNTGQILTIVVVAAPPNGGFSGTVPIEWTRELI